MRPSPPWAPELKAKGTLTAGSDTFLGPAEFLGDSDGRASLGYDVDLAKALGATPGLDTTVQTSEFSGILPALGPKHDLGIPSFTITLERTETVNFVSFFNAGVLRTVQESPDASRPTRR